MPEDTVAPIPAIGSPELASAPPASAPSPAATPASPDAVSGAPSQVQEPKPVDEATKRRAEALARAKREASKARQLQEQLKARDAELASLKEFKTKIDALEGIQKTDPLAFLEKIGLPADTVAKELIKRRTGAGETPSEIAAREVDRRWAEKTAADEKAIKERDELEQKRRNEQTIAGVKRQMADMIKSDTNRFDIISDDPSAVERAWQLCVDFYTQTVDPRTGVGKQLEFGKALDAVETEARKLQKSRLSRAASKALWEEIQKEAVERQAAAAKATEAKPNVSSPKTSGEAPRQQEVQAPTPQPSGRRVPRDPLYVRKEAARLIREFQAKSDN